MRQPMKGLRLTDHPRLQMHPCVERAIARTVDGWMTNYKHLPIPVRFRASGALRAWEQVLDQLPGGDQVRTILADPRRSPHRCTEEFATAVGRHISAHDAEVVLMVQAMLQTSCDLLTFWLRRGALYEPTLPLGNLLGGVDMAEDMPMRYLQPPVPALCILPPWQQRHLCAGAAAVTIFSHDPFNLQTPASRTLMFMAHRLTDDGAIVDQLELPVTDEDASLAATVDRVARSSTLNTRLSPQTEPGTIEEAIESWRKVLDYVVKVLLYLATDGAMLHEIKPYTAAPRDFAGLGRRKRELRQAAIEQLYDRYIVGPQTASDWAGEHASLLGAHGQLTPHWRRGHLRMQAHGPHMTLRKPMFIKPTVVRADLLAGEKSAAA
jgi:hypothetical protein